MKIPFTSIEASIVNEGLRLGKTFTPDELKLIAKRALSGEKIKDLVGGAGLNELKSIPGKAYESAKAKMPDVSPDTSDGALFGAMAGGLYSAMPSPEERNPDTGKFEQPSFWGKSMTNVPIGALIGAAALPRLAKAANARAAEKLASLGMDMLKGVGIAGVGSVIPAALSAYADDEDVDKTLARTLAYALPLGALAGAGAGMAGRGASYMGDLASQGLGALKNTPAEIERIISEYGPKALEAIQTKLIDPAMASPMVQGATGAVSDVMNTVGNAASSTRSAMDNLSKLLFEANTVVDKAKSDIAARAAKEAAEARAKAMMVVPQPKGY